MSQQSIQQLLWYFTQDQNRRSTDQNSNRFCDSVILLAHVDIFIVRLCVLQALISRVYDQDQCESHSAWHTCQRGTCRPEAFLKCVRMIHKWQENTHRRQITIHLHSLILLHVYIRASEGSYQQMCVYWPIYNNIQIILPILSTLVFSPKITHWLGLLPIIIIITIITLPTNDSMFLKGA